jgi:hypothetical protein
MFTSSLFLTLCVGVVVLATPQQQFRFIPSQSYYLSDPLLSSSSIPQSTIYSSSSSSDSNSLSYIQPPAPHPPQQQQLSGGALGGGIGNLFERVIAEATEYVENGENPIPVNNTHGAGGKRRESLSFCAYLKKILFIYCEGHHHEGTAPNGFAHGSHNYLGGHHGGHGMGGHNYCKFTPKSHKLGKVSNIHIRAYEMLTKQYQVPKQQAVSYLRSRLPQECFRETRHLHCDANIRYR